MILSGIVQAKRGRIDEAKKTLPLARIKEELARFDKKTNFLYCLTRSKFMNLIAEIKKASPSKGVLRQDFDPVRIAQVYYASGADALSVLTEEDFFGGHIKLISKIKHSVRLPILRKDFIVDEYQVYESKLYGADAILLIADLLSLDELKGFCAIAEEVGLDVLCEIHNDEDLGKALGANAKMIGINNRNLRTFEVDLNTTAQLAAKIPKGKLIVSESGIKTHQDMLFLKSLGVNAALVGEALMTSVDMGAKLRELIGH